MGRRKYLPSNIRDNVHPNYFHKRGHGYGATIVGSDLLISKGRFENLDVERVQDLNMFEGALTFAPVYKVEEDELSTGGYTWDLTSENNRSVMSDSPGHPILFGMVGEETRIIPNYNREPLGATRLEYTTLTEDEIELLEDWGILGTGKFHIARENDEEHSYDTRARGLHVGYGNIHINTKLPLLENRVQAIPSVYGIVSELNIVATANNKNNTADTNRYGRKDGIRFNTIDGASINLKVGGLEDGSRHSIAGDEEEKKGRGSITLEADGIENGSTLGLHQTRDNNYGSGAAFSPSPDNAGMLPWQYNLPVSKTWAGWTETPYVGSGLVENAGGLAHIFALSQRKNIHNVKVSGQDLEESFKGGHALPYGRLLFEATNNIDLYIPSYLPNMDSSGNGGVSGFYVWLDNVSLQDRMQRPGRVKYRQTETSRVIHRELRLWGVEDQALVDGTETLSTDSVYNTTGTNINLMYGFKHTYSKFGRLQNWDSGLKHSATGESLHTLSHENSPWFDTRTRVLQSIQPSDYGSSIRNASFIDSYKGIRHDPHFSYVKEYIIPFELTIPLGVIGIVPGSEWVNLLISNWPVETENGNIDQYYSILSGDAVIPITRIPQRLEDRYGNPIFIDQIIKEIENEMLETSGYPNIDNYVFGSSIVDFSMVLDRYILVDDENEPAAMHTASLGFITSYFGEVIDVLDAGGRWIESSLVPQAYNVGFTALHSSGMDSAEIKSLRNSKYNVTLGTCDVDTTAFDAVSDLPDWNTYNAELFPVLKEVLDEKWPGNIPQFAIMISNPGNLDEEDYFLHYKMIKNEEDELSMVYTGNMRIKAISLKTWTT
jgi:hypothetical protein